MLNRGGIDEQWLAAFIRQNERNNGGRNEGNYLACLGHVERAVRARPQLVTAIDDATIIKCSKLDKPPASRLLDLMMCTMAQKVIRVVRNPLINQLATSPNDPAANRLLNAVLDNGGIDEQWLAAFIRQNERNNGGRHQDDYLACLGHIEMVVRARPQLVTAIDDATIVKCAKLDERPASQLVGFVISVMPQRVISILTHFPSDPGVNRLFNTVLDNGGIDEQWLAAFNRQNERNNGERHQNDYLACLGHVERVVRARPQLMTAIDDSTILKCSKLDKGPASRLLGFMISAMPQRVISVLRIPLISELAASPNDPAANRLFNAVLDNGGIDVAMAGGVH